jgi:hypothetical protein
MRAPLVLVVLLGCSKPPPPKAPAAEQTADKVADIAGRWAANDELDWGYTMTIDAGGGIDVWIDRGKMGRCEQIGKIVGKATRVFTVTYVRGECNPEAVGIPIDMTVASFTGETLTVVVAEQRRTYARAN